MTKKRLFDLTVSVGLTPATLIATAACCVVITADTRTWPLYSQTRVGQHGKPFRIHKLRTMRPDTPDLPSHLAGTGSVTRSGKWIRKFKLDELPQLWNVIRGEMSLVGPRPCLPTQSELAEARAEHDLGRLKPGITGYGQLSGLDMSTPAPLAINDAKYNHAWSAREDLSILWKTVTGEGRGDAASANPVAQIEPQPSRPRSKVGS